MPALTIPNSFSPSTTAQSSQVNANFNAVATLLNSTKLDADNIQALGITAALIAANAVTGAKLNSNVVDDSTLQYTSSQLSIKALGVGTAHLAASAVTTAKLNDGAVTQAKRAALGQQISSSCSNFSTSSTSLTAVTNLSVTITTTGRPVFIGLVPDGDTTNNSYWLTSSSGLGLIWAIKEDTTIVGRGYIPNNGGGMNMPAQVGSTWLIYVPGAGTYTYTMNMASLSAGSSQLNYAKLVAYEL